MVQLDRDGRPLQRLGHPLQVVVTRRDGDAAWPESAAHQDVERTSGVGLADEQVDVAHRPEPWIAVHQMRERGTLQDEEWHLRLRHRAGDVSDHPGPDCRCVRVLRPPRPEASTEVGRNRQACPLDVREHERLHAVLFRRDRELVERRNGRQRGRQMSRDSSGSRPLCTQRQEPERAVGQRHARTYQVISDLAVASADALRVRRRRAGNDDPPPPAPRRWYRSRRQPPPPPPK